MNQKMFLSSFKKEVDKVFVRIYLKIITMFLNVKIKEFWLSVYLNILGFGQYARVFTFELNSNMNSLEKIYHQK